MKTYRTKDLPEAAALSENGMMIVDYERIDGTTYFIFDNGHQCETLAKKYRLGKLSVSALRYEEIRKSLLQIVH